VAKPPSGEQRARQLFSLARSAFQSESYDVAARNLNALIGLSPRDSAAYQLRSLVHLATEDYRNAAADAYDGLQFGRSWTRASLQSVYANMERYQQQFDQLASQAAADAGSHEKQFLLAYHLLVLGRLEQGEKQLQKVLEIQPDEVLASRLLQQVRSGRAARQLGQR